MAHPHPNSSSLTDLSLSYLSSSSGIGGRIKSTPEDFRVEEIQEDGTIFEIDKEITGPMASDAASVGGHGCRFTHFVLQKTDWSTSSAISEIARRFHSGQSRFNTAGTKDKSAITTQLVSGFGFRPEQLRSIRIKDIQINGAWLAKDKVRIGQLLGNRFSVRVRDVLLNATPDATSPDASEVQSRVDKIFEELGKYCESGSCFPNYFGEQRFGSTRKNTHKIGLHLVKGDFESAVKSLLCDTEGEENTEASAARKQLAADGDHQKALQYFPKHLRLERTVIANLATRQGDYAGALRKLPRSILLLYIHAVQSHIFNISLSERIKISSKDQKPLELEDGEFYCGETLGFPDTDRTDATGHLVGRIIGYETMLNERERILLESLGIDKEQFRLPKIPELASKGTKRILLAPMKDFNFEPKTTTFRFSLPSGCYATVAMREFMKIY